MEAQRSRCFRKGEGAPISDAAGRRWKTPFPASAQDFATVLTSRNTTCMTEPVSHTGMVKPSSVKHRGGLACHITWDAEAFCSVLYGEDDIDGVDFYL